jgi:gliding motility-associated-like protein
MASRILFFISLFGLLYTQALAQCEVLATVAPTTIVCGDYAELTAFGQGQGQQVFNENFNSGAPSGWAFTQQATYTNPCSPGGVDGTTHIWMGNNSGVPRSLVTQSYNFTTATSGVTVCFDMLFAEQGNAAPCEGPDEPTEGVALQYSIDGGNTWITINYFDPNGGNDPQLVNWNNWCFQLPPAAITTNTQIRWFQDADSGADYDHWGIDNVEIYYNDPTYNITWTHDNYSYGTGSSGGVNPNRVNPGTSTDYYVVMTNGSTTCRDTVRLNVVNPTIEINAGNDTSICPSTCANLNATAKVIKSPAKTPTYSNTQLEAIQTGFGATTNINVNVVGLNMTNILPGSITQVCITGLTFFGFNLFPPGQQTIGDLEIRLVCPDGTRILLVPSGVTTSTAIAGYSQTCFTPVSVTNIGSGSTPYSGQFQPNQPFSNLVGCTANGVWSIEVRSTAALSFGTGFFTGWSITFDDPEISYPANITWSPTTNMTGSTTLTPQVCPTGTTTYTLSASDTAGCVTVTDQVTVTILPSCCNLTFGATSANPTCGASNGSININVTQGTGPYTYVWADGPTGATRNSLPAGTYTVSITDNGQANCVKDTTITLTSPNSPVINSITPTAETCAGFNDGSIAVNASGGTGTLTYTWTPANSGANISNLADGNYTVTVTDANGCSATANTSVAAGPPCCNLAISIASTNPTCAGLDGSITVNVTTGSGNYTYAWTGGFSATNTLANIGSGTYSVTVTDVTQGCDLDTTISLSSANGPVVDNITSTNETCLGENDGTATVTASGGTGAFTYLWNTVPAQTTATATNLAPGCYSVVVTDALGCEAFGQVCLAAGPNCCNLSYTITTANPTCGNNDGSVNITNLGGSGSYSFLWSDNSSGQNLLNVGAGTYGVTITDITYPNCQLDTTISLSNPNAPVINNITATAESCLGANDGTVDMTITCGTLPCTVSWSNGAPTEDLSGLAPGTYNVTVTDGVGCVATGFIAVPAGPNCCNLAFDLDVIDPSCGQNNGSLEVTNVTGTGPFINIWSNGASTALISNLAAGTYTVTVTDNGQPNCQLDSTITITDAGSPAISNISGTDEACAGAGNGTATVTAAGGAAPLSYAWSNSATGSSISNLTPGNYDVTVTDANGCSVTGQVVIGTGPVCCSLSASATTTPASCGTADGSITVTVDVATGTAPFQYNLDGGSFGASNVFTVGGGNYTVIARDVNGCDTTLLVTVNEANNTLILTPSSFDPTCPGGTDGWVGINVAGGTPPNVVIWSTGGSTDTLLNLGAGTYNVTVTDVSNCSAFQSITLTDPAPPSVNLGNDIDLCDGETTNLDAGLAGAYVWSTGDTTQGITAASSGTYSVTITNAGGCTATDDILITVATPFTVDAGEDTTIIQFESVLELAGTVTGSAGGSYLWTPSDYLACDNCQTTSLSPDSTTTYVLVYTDALGCSATDSVTITVLPGEYIAIVPNAFSPNADGTNDILYVYHKGVRRLVFRVHDRWGEKVFETDDMNKGWDGTLKGVNAQDGVYVWDLYVEFLNLKIPAQRSKGSVLLLK